MTTSKNQSENQSQEQSPLDVASARHSAEALPASELLEQLKQEMEEELAADPSPLKTTLEELKSTPSNLEDAYFRIPAIAKYCSEKKDEIDGSLFSEFGSLGAITDLWSEMKPCWSDLPKSVTGGVDDLLKTYNDKDSELEYHRKKDRELHEEVLSEREQAKKKLEQKKCIFCDLSGASYKITLKDEKGNAVDKVEPLTFCKENEEQSGSGRSSGEPRGTAARIVWCASELVRMFKKLGVTEEKGKRGVITCESLSPKKVEIYAYSLEIKRKIDMVKAIESEADGNFKKELDTALKGWITATWDYFNAYMKERNRGQAYDKSKQKLGNFRETREEKFLRDALDVQGAESSRC